MWEFEGKEGKGGGRGRGMGRRINIHQEVILTMRKRRFGAGHSFDGLRGVSFEENCRRFQSISQCKGKKPATYQLSL
jgi:hypothetical protein